MDTGDRKRSGSGSGSGSGTGSGRRRVLGKLGRPRIHPLSPSIPPIPVIAANVCLRCGHTWARKTDRPLPKVCPACTTRLWHIPRVRNYGGRPRIHPLVIRHPAPVVAPDGMDPDTAERFLLSQRLLRLKRRLPSLTNTQIGTLLGAHRNSVERWLAGTERATPKHYAALDEAERTYALRPYHHLDEPDK